uniref:Innexin n=1 Tax=Macrostomum lignano TaxID=282301 RepID=A0A1I8I4C6_9PLAT
GKERNCFGWTSQAVVSILAISWVQGERKEEGAHRQRGEHFPQTHARSSCSMAAAEIFDKFNKLQQVTYAGVEDFSDRLNFEVTVILLLVCCTTVTLKTYVLSPVACYIPNEVGAHSGQEQYVNNYCWTEGTFAVPIAEFHIDNSQPDPIGVYRDRRIVYYQWVPFVLGLQSLMFYLPRVLWGMMSYNRAGTDIGHIIRTANDAVTAMARSMQSWCSTSVEGWSSCFFSTTRSTVAVKLTTTERLRGSFRRLLPSQRLGNWLIFTYFIIKMCYIGNAVGQLYLMHSFLGFNASYFAFGAAVLQNLRHGRDWTQTMIFPRVGVCAVFYRAPAGGNYVYSQCTLPINMINEKIYIFLWFWVITTASLTALSLP